MVAGIDGTRFYLGAHHANWLARVDVPLFEPVMLAKTGLTVAEHQRRTVANYLQLRALAPEVAFIPVLQGWTTGDYLLRTSGGSAGSKVEATELARASCWIDLRRWLSLNDHSGGTATGRVKPRWPSRRRVLAYPSEIRSFEACAVQIGTAKIGAMEVRVAQVGTAEVCRLQARLDKVSPSKVCTAEICFVKPRTTQVGSLQQSAPDIRLAQVRVCKTALLKMNLAALSTGEVCKRQRGTRKARLRKIRVAQICPWQMCRLVIVGCDAAAEHDEADLDVRGTISQPGKSVVDCAVWMRCSIFGRSGGPRGMGAHKRLQYSGNRLPIYLGIPCNTLQSKDAAEPDIELVAAELVDGTREPLGNLPFTCDLDLPPRREGRCDQEQAASPLQQRAPGVVLQPGLALLEFDSFLRSRHRSQLSRRQRRIEQLRKEQDASQERQKQGDGQHGKPGGTPLHPSRPLPALYGVPTTSGAWLLHSLPSEDRGWKSLRWWRSPDPRRAERDNGWLGQIFAHLIELLPGASQAGLEPVNLAEPASLVRLRDAVLEVGDDRQQPRFLHRVGSQHRAADAPLTELNCSIVLSVRSVL
jgi:hypothetical protein